MNSMPVTWKRGEIVFNGRLVTILPAIQTLTPIAVVVGNDGKFYWMHLEEITCLRN